MSKRKFLLGFVPSMLIIGLPCILASMQMKGASSAITSIFGIVIPIGIGVLISKINKK